MTTKTTLRIVYTTHDACKKRFVYLSYLGDISHAPVHEDIELVVGEHLFPHDNRQLGQRVEIVVRNVSGLQDGRFADVVHITDVVQHEQTANNKMTNNLITHVCTFTGKPTRLLFDQSYITSKIRPYTKKVCKLECQNYGC